jgi:ABC-type antimicrobial peptide transport system permease subunit
VTWLDSLVLAARNVARRPGRAVLTVIAVALAAALFSALLTIAATARTRVLDQLSNGGPLAGIEVAAAAPDPAEVDNDNARPGAPRNLDDDALGQMAGLADVRSVVPVTTTRVVVVPPVPFTAPDGRTLSFDDDVSRRDRARGGTFETLVGTDVGRADDLPVSILAGRLPIVGSEVEVAVTPSWLAHFGLDRGDGSEVVGTRVQIGAPRAFDGDVVRLRWTSAVVVGVVAQQAAPGALLGSLELVAAGRSWTQQGAGGERFGVDESPYSAAFVVARGLDDVSNVRNEITGIGYSTRAPENLIARVQRYLHVVELVLTAIGVISLVIAALGVTNTLLAAVRERRREIGVLKAIGARDGDVVRLFLLEAAALGVAGGVVGTFAGLGMASIVAAVVNDYLRSQSLASVDPELSPLIIAAGIAGAGALALVAGVVPALRAARLSAREAVET